MIKKILTFIFIFFVSTVQIFAEEEPVIMPSATGIIQNVNYVDLENNVAQVKQMAEVKILNGGLKGQIITVDNMLTGNPYYDIKLKKGMKVILHLEENEGNIDISIEDIHRSGVLTWLSLLFCGLLIYVGKKKGLYSLLSIIITGLLIFKLLSPMILIGISPIIGAILICIISTAVTIYLVGGFNRKSSAAAIGCILSLLTAGLLSFITVKAAHLTGFSGENTLFLYSAHPELNFISITIAMMMLAALGAVMDVAMSISSTINEIFTVDSTKTVKELFFSGMNVGRDIIGTMANTLILVYLGGALPLILLTTNIDLHKFINLNQVVTEIASAIIGSCSIIICVPITAIVAAELIRKIPQNTDFSDLQL